MWSSAHKKNTWHPCSSIYRCVSLTAHRWESNGCCWHFLCVNVCLLVFRFFLLLFRGKWNYLKCFLIRLVARHILCAILVMASELDASRRCAWSGYMKYVHCTVVYRIFICYREHWVRVSTQQWSSPSRCDAWTVYPYPSQLHGMQTRAKWICNVKTQSLACEG